MRKNFENKARTHDELVSKIKELLNASGFKCQEEVEVEIKWKETLKGKIDLVCEKGDKIYIIEVKGYPLSKSKIPFEALQVILYAKIFSENEKKEVVPTLVFKINEKGLVEVATLSKEELNISVEEVPLEDLAPGPWCALCRHFRSGLCTYKFNH